MLDYIGETGPNVEMCRLIVGRLLGHVPVQPIQKQPPQNQVSKILAELREEFIRLAAQADRNKAGLALERLLNRLLRRFNSDLGSLSVLSENKLTGPLNWTAKPISWSRSGKSIRSRGRLACLQG